MDWNCLTSTTTTGGITTIAMPVATTSSGRSLYDHASTAFVRNMPLEALSTISKALENGQAQSSQQLAEQFIVLYITALCAVYTPNDPSQMNAKIQHWRQTSGKADVHLPTALDTLFSSPPTPFFAALWSQVIRFYQHIPLLPSLGAQDSPLQDAKSIVQSPGVLNSALQLPAPVFEALVLGALKVDEDLSRHAEKANGRTKNAKDAVAPGIEAARAMCEWLLAAHSSSATQEIIEPSEQRHLYDQYGRVLRLYALDVLGLRQHEWDYAGEMIRCAKLITNDEREIHERTALLDELAQAQSQAEVRIDRHQAAKERARRYMQEQLEKRKAMAASMYASSTSDGQASPVQARNSSNGNVDRTDRRGGSMNGGNHQRTRSPFAQSPLTSPVSEKSAETAAMANGRGMKSASRSSRPRSSSASSSEQTSSHMSTSAGGASGSNSKRVVQRNNSTSNSLVSFQSLRTTLQAWLRSIGGGPFAIMFALFVIVALGRRVVGMLKVGSSPANTMGSTLRTSNGEARRLSAVSAKSRQQPQSQGAVAKVWQKLLNTVRM